MAIDVNDATLPLDSNASSPASEGAGELRALKSKINALWLTSGVDATWPKLINVSRGFNFDIIDGSISDLQTSKFKVTRNVNAAGKHTWGFTAESALANNISVTTGFVAGMTAFATIGTGCTFGAAYAMNVGIYQQTHNNATGQCIGLYLQFADRLTAGSAAPGGLGSNQYNNNAIAMQIDAFPRSSSGEYCGWKYGIRFGANSMDRDIAGAGYCIDMSLVNPAVIQGGIKLASLIGIIWDAADTQIMYYDAVALRLNIRCSGTIRWALDVSNGNIYKNGVLQY